MADKNEEAEIHPLKNEEGKGLENSDCNSGQKEVGYKIQTKLSRLSRWRTAAFFIALFLCLIVVFAFSFILPCPVRPVSVRTWSRTFHNAATYGFLAEFDVNKDKVMDVLFALKGSNSSLNASCSDEGLPSPCAFVVAVSGTNGSALWEKPVAEDILLMECGLQKLGEVHSSGCLVLGKPDLLVAVDSETGKTHWKQKVDLGNNTSVLNHLLQLPDLDGDGVSDVLLLTIEGEEGSLFMAMP